MIAEFLENATRLEQAAEGAVVAKLKESLLRHAAAYRKLANDRAKELGLPMPKMPSDQSPQSN
jgi:hypothetical protein